MIKNNYKSAARSQLMIPGAEQTSICVLIGQDRAPNFLMMQLDIQPGGHTPDHRHEWEEEIFVISGKATLKTEEGEERLEPGDAFILPPDAPHQFVNNGDQPFRFLCVIPRRG